MSGRPISFAKLKCVCTCVFAIGNFVRLVMFGSRSAVSTARKFVQSCVRAGHSLCIAQKSLWNGFAILTSRVRNEMMMEMTGLARGENE